MELFSEAKFKDSISFVIYNNLHLAKLQICFLKTMHQPPWSCNDHIRVEQQSLELVLHVIASCYQNHGKIGELSHHLKVLRRLQGNLSGRRQNQAPGTHYLRMALQSFNDGDDECSSFSTACPGHCDHVEPLNDSRY